MTQINPDIAAEAAKLAAAPAPGKPADVAFADLLGGGASLDLDALIAQARADLSVAPQAIEKGKLEAPDAGIVNTLLAQADAYKRTADEAAAQREKINVFLAELVESEEAKQGLNPGDIAELTVNGATVWTYAQTTSRVLNQAQVKSVFPDIPENAEFWTESTRRTRSFK